MLLLVSDGGAQERASEAGVLVAQATAPGAGPAAGTGTGSGSGTATGTGTATGGTATGGGTPTGTGTATGAGTATGGTATGSIPDRDANFVMTAASSGLAEVAAGQLALQKASNAAVKQHAQRMIDDHTAANHELMTIAREKQLPTPDEPNQTHKQMVEKLRTQSGAEFDAAYMQAEVQEHRSAVALFRQQKDGGGDAKLAAFAGRTLPKLEHHLEEALKIADDVALGKKK